MLRDGAKERQRIGPFEGDGHLPAMRHWSIKVRDAVANAHQIHPSFADGLACSEVIERLVEVARERPARRE